MPQPDTHHVAGTHGTVAPVAAAVVALVFLLVGVLGFVPAATTGVDGMSFASHGSEAMLLGVFQVSVLHNILHLLFGVVGLVMARHHASARRYLLWGGVVYAVLFLYGRVVPQDSAANVVPVNAADDWLHLGLAVLMIGAALLTRPRPTELRVSDAA